MTEDLFPDDPADLDPEFEEDAESVNQALLRGYTDLFRPPAGLAGPNRTLSETGGEEHAE